MFALDSKIIGTLLPLGEIVFVEGTVECDNLQQRTSAIYQRVSVWIEWKDDYSLGPENEQIRRQIGLLTDLRFVKSEGFRAPPCLGTGDRR